jgi:hypothetical protein
MARRTLVVVLMFIGVIFASPGLVAEPGTVSVSPVQRIIDGSVVGGAFSQLVRGHDSIRMHVSTADLDAGAAYTVWWVIFNNPEHCLDGCGLDDIMNPDRRAATQVAVGFAAGHVVSQKGTGNFSARLAVGDLSGFGDGLDVTPPPPFGPGLLDPMGAEVHLVIRTHGRQIPTLVDDQISSFEGGCGINPCVDKQFSVHLPPS